MAVKVLSLGAGVQSSALLLMSCRGVLPKLDAAIFADTQWEPQGVYETLAFLEGEASKVGIPVHRVTIGSLREHTLTGFVRGTKTKQQRYASMPMHTIDEHGLRGMVRRQCTRDYKIRPIEKCVRQQVLGLKPRQHAPANSVDQWFGISADEAQRMRTSDTKWQTNIYPLIGVPNDMLPKRMNRNDCHAWLAEHYPGREFPRSACIGCPFHSDHEWRGIKAREDEWSDAVELDGKIRKAGGMRGDVFLHRSCKPLADVDLRTDVEKGQGVFGFGETCDGYCGT